MAKKVSKKKVNLKKKVPKKHAFKLVIGDWSDDGHGSFDEFAYESNCSLTRMQNAYKNSCKLVGLQFNINEDFTGLVKTVDWGSKDYSEAYDYNQELNALCEYQDGSFSEAQLAKLKAHGLKVDEDNLGPQELSDLILNFIKLSLPELKWKEKAVKISELKNINFPTLNGWWCSGLNHQFGYGLYG